MRIAIPLALASLVSVAATPALAVDPLEPFNRRVHDLNRSVQTVLLDPVASAWHRHASPGVRQGVSNVLANLREPITAASLLAAGEVRLALDSAARFGINTSLGLGGVRDSAAEYDLPRQDFTIADTLCRWGVPAGPFLMLPILGPSTLRDAGALVATGAALGHALGPEAFLSWRGTDVLEGYTRLAGELARIDAESLDPYAVYRSAYLQRRARLCPGDRIAPDDE
jgi:phospholipid-binding lipoprotein MlaA